MAVRKNLSHPEKVRQRIRTTQLVRRLTKHVLGQVDMNATQVSAALGLLKKTLPDLSAVEHSGEVVNRNVTELSDDALASIAAGSSQGATEATGSTKDPSPVH